VAIPKHIAPAARNAAVNLTTDTGPLRDHEGPLEESRREGRRPAGDRAVDAAGTLRLYCLPQKTRRRLARFSRAVYDYYNPGS